jgi:hypothetical protein
MEEQGKASVKVKKNFFTSVWSKYKSDTKIFPLMFFTEILGSQVDNKCTIVDSQGERGGFEANLGT